MKEPVCILCGVAHWSHEPHNLGPVTVRPDVMRVLGSAYKAKVTVGKIPDKPQRIRTEQEIPDRESGHCVCGQPLPVSKTKPKRFCSDACRKRASRT